MGRRPGGRRPEADAPASRAGDGAGPEGVDIGRARLIPIADAVDERGQYPFHQTAAARIDQACAAPQAGRPLWYPPYSGQLAIDKRLAEMYRTDSKQLDEARDHGLEQLRHGHRRPPTLAPEAVWPVLEQARQAALAGRSTPLEALQQAERAVQAHLDEAWATLKPLS